jgi:hypothetical protein
MAVGATSLRFQVEIQADQATEGLRALQVAANQAGVTIKQSLQGVGGAAQRANSGIMDLRRGMSQGRQAALFFGRALGDLAPAGSAAQSAISGIGGALFAATGAMAGLLLALEGLRFAINYFQDLKKASEAAAAAVVKAESTLRFEAAETAAVQAEARGDKTAAAQIRARAELNRLDEEAARLTKELTAAKDELADRSDNLVRVLPKEQALEDKIKSTTAELATIETKRVRLASELGVKLRDLSAELSKYNEELAKHLGIAKELQVVQGTGTGNIALPQDLSAEIRTQIGRSGAAANLPEIINFEPFLEELKAAEEAAKRSAEAMQKSYTTAAVSIGGVMGSMFGQMIAGEKDMAAVTIKSVLSIVQALAVEAIMRAAAKNAWNPIAAGAAAAAVMALTQGIMAAMPQPRAMGGPVRPDQPYVVGERGPERFVPDRAGTIIPNHALGGSEIHFHGLFIDGPGVERAFRRMGRHASRGLSASQRNRRA